MYPPASLSFSDDVIINSLVVLVGKVTTLIVFLGISSNGVTKEVAAMLILVLPDCVEIAGGAGVVGGVGSIFSGISVFTTGFSAGVDFSACCGLIIGGLGDFGVLAVDVPFFALGGFFSLGVLGADIASPLSVSFWLRGGGCGIVSASALFMSELFRVVSSFFWAKEVSSSLVELAFMKKKMTRTESKPIDEMIMMGAEEDFADAKLAGL